MHRIYRILHNRFGLLLLGLVSMASCATPDHTTEGAVGGGLLGGGLGALIGSASGHAGAGAAIGAGVGALTGAAMGSNVDAHEAEGRAIAAARRPVGTVTVDDVIVMTQNRTPDDVIINQVHANRMVAPIQTGDILRLQQAGVSSLVITAMQESPPVPPPAVYVDGPGYYGDPYYHRHHYYYY